MRSTIIRQAAVAALAITALGSGAAQAAGADPGSPAQATPAQTATGPAQAGPAKDSPVAVEVEKGIVFEGSATIDGQEALVTVYDNSRYGSSITVVVGDPENGGYFGYAEQATAYVVDGQLNATVELGGTEATLSGTFVENGQPTRIRESIQDAGQQIVTQGTNTPLQADVTIAIDGEAVPVEAGTAFAYDLQVRKIDLYGN